MSQARYRASTDSMNVCAICQTEVEYLGDGYYRYARSGRQADASTPGQAFVCSKACRSQFVYNCATPKEQQALRALAILCELNGSVLPLAMRRKEESNRGLVTYRNVPNEETSYARYFDPGDLFDMWTAVEKVSANMCGDISTDPPAWYVDAIDCLGRHEQVAR